MRRITALISTLITMTLCSPSEGSTELVVNNTSNVDIQVAVCYAYNSNWIAYPEGYPAGSPNEVDGFFNIPKHTAKTLFSYNYAGNDEQLEVVWLRVLVNNDHEIKGPLSFTINKSHMANHTTADNVTHYWITGAPFGGHIKSMNIVNYLNSNKTLLFFNAGIKGKGKLVTTIHD